VDGKRGDQSSAATAAATTTATCEDNDAEAASYRSFLSTSHIGGMALAPEGTMLYVTARQGRSIVLLRIHLGLSSDDNDDDDDDDDDEEDENVKDKNDFTRPTTDTTMVPHVVWDFSQPPSVPATSAESSLAASLARIQHPGPIAVDRSGRVYLGAGKEGGVLVLDVAQHEVVAQLDTGGAMIRALTLGEDGFMYLATDAGSLLRMRIRDGPVKVPTNLVRKPPKAKAAQKKL